jgi:hypothetical protein
MLMLDLKNFLQMIVMNLNQRDLLKILIQMIHCK